MLTDVEKVPLRAALEASRREQLNHGHDWDVADALAAVVGVLNTHPIEPVPEIVICSDARHQHEQEKIRQAVDRIRHAASIPGLEEHRDRVRAVHSALANLVRLKQVKDEAHAILGSATPSAPISTTRHATAEQELRAYEAEKPFAWAVARKALAELQPGDV